MIQTLRNQTGSWLVKILLLLVVLSFGVWGIGDFFRDAPPDTIVATVGTIEIDINTVNTEFQNEVDLQRRLSGGNYSTEEALSDGLVDLILDSLINQALLIQMGVDINLVIPDEIVIAQIRSQSGFQNQLTGQFDNQLLLQYLARNRLSEEAYVEQIRRELQQGVLRLSVARGAWVPEVLGDALYGYQQEGRIADTVTIPYTTITEIPEPTEADLRSFHAENEELFLAPEYRNLTVIAIGPDDFADSIAVSDDDLAVAYDQRQAQFVAAERRQFDQAILSDQADATALAEAARASGSLSDAVAAMENIDAQIIPLDWSTRSDLFAELADAAFALPENGISEPLETPFGWHVLQLTGLEAEQIQPFEEVADELRRDVQIDRALDIVFEQVNALDDEIAAGTDLNEAATVLGLTAVGTSPIAADGSVQDGGTAPNLPVLPAIAAVAFQLDEGEASFLEETDDGIFFTVRVDGIVAPEVRPLDDVREAVIAAWQNAARGERAAQRAELAAQRLAAANDPDAVAQEFSGTAGVTPPLLRDGSNRGTLSAGAVERLFGLSVGEVAVVDDGINQIVMRLETIELPVPDAENAAYTAIQQRTENAMGSDLLQQFLQQLQETVDVEIHQSVLDRQYQQS